jgi:CubicO group peptidase (beta-lactamase class C family)
LFLSCNRLVWPGLKNRAVVLFSRPAIIILVSTLITLNRSPRMKTTFVFIFLFALAGCAAVPGASHRVGGDDDIAPTIQRLMQRERVQGMAVAVIDDGKVTQVSAFGRRSAKPDQPLTVNTVMYGASLTKAAFSYMVLQLVDEGKLKLDATMPELLPRPLPDYESYADLKDDPRWRLLTPRMLMNHTTGFANFRWLETDKRLQFHFTPGQRYAYSGEGFYLLQFVLEKGLGLDVGKEMQTRVFDRFGMTRTSMRWRPDFATDLADGFDLTGAVTPHDQRSNVRAAGSMDTTISDQAKLWAGIMRGDGLSAASRAEFTRPQFAITSRYQFPTFTTETDARNADIGLSAGLGVIAFRDASGAAWYKGGHNDTTGNMVVCLESGKRCVVLLANDVRAELIYPDVVQLILGDTTMPWRWEYH